LKKPPRPLKRKHFMKIFFSGAAEYHGAALVSNRRADSGPCVRNPKAAALICGREANSVGIQFSATAVARKIRHAITWIVRNAHGSFSSADRAPKADAQIGGGMHVSDAFPATVGLQLIAI
jgi:hypothetical protein